MAASAPRTEAQLVDEARDRKASALVAVLQAHGIGSADAALLNDEQRSVVAQTAGVRFPSQTTWWLVLGRLVEQEADGQYAPDIDSNLCPDCQRGNPRTNTVCGDCMTRPLALVRSRG